MALNIQTFHPQQGGATLFKALGHPHALQALRDIVAAIQAAAPVAVYDPYGYLDDFLALTGLGVDQIGQLYVQKIEAVMRPRQDVPVALITDVSQSSLQQLWILSFDQTHELSHIQHLLPQDCQVHSLQSLKLPADWLAMPWDYLNRLNFATNFAFFREQDRQHTLLSTFNYWSRYGAKNQQLWCCLFDEAGEVLATWQQDLQNAVHGVRIDSQEVRQRFDLPEFTGQLFVHFTGVAGHEVVKYALDTYGDDDDVLSVTHDANAWPSDYFGGLPAPDKDQKIILWLQNSHPVTIPAGDIKLQVMGEEATAVAIDQDVAPFATVQLDIGALMPDVTWPQQIELLAGKYFVRPRYEVVHANQRSCIAHVNVERLDLKPDTQLADALPHIGKGYILPAPILPCDQFSTVMLPTPMSRSTEHLPLKVLVFDHQGNQLVEHKFGNLPRNHQSMLNVSELAQQGGDFKSGHLEMVYDFELGTEVDGWLHAIFRYQHVDGHHAETSFGSHLFNHPLTYRNEPQSYAGPPPGTTTRLLLRLAPPDRGWDTWCQLVYPVSAQWHAQSDTHLQVMGVTGELLAEKVVQIASSGSYAWLFSDLVTEFPEAAQGEYVVISDRTCRLFGYHGLRQGEGVFSLDHMFGA